MWGGHKKTVSASFLLRFNVNSKHISIWPDLWDFGCSLNGWVIFNHWILYCKVTQGEKKKKEQHECTWFICSLGDVWQNSVLKDPPYIVSGWMNDSQSVESTHTTIEVVLTISEYLV